MFFICEIETNTETNNTARAQTLARIMERITQINHFLLLFAPHSAPKPPDIAFVTPSPVQPCRCAHGPGPSNCMHRPAFYFERTHSVAHRLVYRVSRDTFCRDGMKTRTKSSLKYAFIFIFFFQFIHHFISRCTPAMRII